jgi:DNA-binding transcriptional MerR regulator
MHIGGVAKKIGLTPDAIRFYERNALLPRPSRTAGGFRQYADTDLETLRFIRQAQGLGFTLKEVRELLALRGSRLQPCVRCTFACRQNSFRSGESSVTSKHCNTNCNRLCAPATTHSTGKGAVALF